VKKYDFIRVENIDRISKKWDHILLKNSFTKIDAIPRLSLLMIVLLQTRYCKIYGIFMFKRARLLHFFFFCYTFDRQ
jgi:hypothetical protein